MIKHTSTTSSIIIALKSIFTGYGVPATLFSDNRPQFACAEMEEFLKSYSFNHITSSPHYPQSNRLVERTVKTVKQLLRSAPDPYLALLSYRATPILWCLRSPGELLMGRQVRTDVPETTDHFILNWHFLADFKEKDTIGIHKKK